MNYAIMHVFNGEEVTINFKNRIHFGDVEEIVGGIVDGVFEDNVYFPTRFNYFYWYLVLSQYSDLDLFKFDSDEIYEIIEEDCEFLEKVRSVVSNAQLDIIRNKAEELIKLRLNEHPLTKLVAGFEKLMKQFEKLASEAQKNPSVIDSIIDQLPDETVDKIVNLLNAK